MVGPSTYDPACMKEHNIKRLSEAIADYLKFLKIEGKLQETDLIRSWERVMGKTIARETEKIYIKNSVLHVHLKSAALRNELAMMKSKVLDLLNEGRETPVVRDVTFR